MALMGNAEEVAATARFLRASLTDNQLVWRPDEQTWSVADCFEHLRKVDKGYCRVFDGVLSRASRVRGGAFRPAWSARLFLWAIAPGSRLKLPAPGNIRPRHVPAGEGAEALERFLEQQADVQKIIQQADGYDLNGPRIASPFSSLLKLSLGEALTGVVLHEQRHAAQAIRLTQHSDFPAASSSE